MQGFGGLLFLLGAGSVVLHFLNMEFRLLSWIDNWGPEIGWAIRAGMIVVGAALWLMSSGGGDEGEADA
ncbi:MAG: hypothetical protein ACR2O4_06285 [Hyphomicrobiaceae bacterium]